MATISQFLDDKLVSEKLEFVKAYTVEIRKLANSDSFRWIVRFKHHTIVSNQSYSTAEVAELACKLAGYLD